MKDDKIKELESKVSLFKHVDLDKYRNLTSDLRIANTTLQQVKDFYQNEKTESEQRLEALRSKDKQLASLKYLMQQAIFHMMVDVKEMVDKTQTAKETLGDEVEGFDEENYNLLQEDRMTTAQRSLQKIRHTAIGVVDEGSKELYERRVDTNFKLEELLRFQDEVQVNMRKMAMSLGLNIASFTKFLKNRLRIMNNSIKRQATLIQELITQNE